MTHTKWMPSWKHLKHFVKGIDEETFELFFSRHKFLDGKKASPEALRKHIVRVNSRGNVEWSVNMFLKFWIDDRERKRLFDKPQVKKEPKVIVKKQQTPELTPYQKYLHTCEMVKQTPLVYEIFDRVCKNQLELRKINEKHNSN